MVSWSVGIGVGCSFGNGGGVDLMVFTERREHVSYSFLLHHHQGSHHGNPPHLQGMQGLQSFIFAFGCFVTNIDEACTCPHEGMNL